MNIKALQHRSAKSPVEHSIAPRFRVPHTESTLLTKFRGRCSSGCSRPPPPGGGPQQTLLPVHEQGSRLARVYACDNPCHLDDLCENIGTAPATRATSGDFAWSCCAPCKDCRWADREIDVPTLAGPPI